MDHNNKDNKEDQVENLMNLVERHTRTERHLEQYSHIGSEENKNRAREKQDVREQEMEKLKSKIVSDNNESKTEQIQNLTNKYRSAENYMEDNYEHIPEQNLQNMQNKQQNRKEQIENLSKKINGED